MANTFRLFVFIARYHSKPVDFDDDNETGGVKHARVEQPPIEQSATKPWTLAALPPGGLVLPNIRYIQAPPLPLEDADRGGWRPNSPPYPTGDSDEDVEVNSPHDPFGAAAAAKTFEGLLHPVAERIIRELVHAGTCLPRFFTGATDATRDRYLAAVRSEMALFSPHITCTEEEKIKVLEASRYLTSSKNLPSAFSAARLLVTRAAHDRDDLDAYLGWTINTAVQGNEMRMKFVKGSNYAARGVAAAHLTKQQTISDALADDLARENAILRARLAALDQAVLPPPQIQPVLWSAEKLKEREKEMKAAHMKGRAGGSHTASAKGKRGWAEAKFGLLELGGILPDCPKQKDALLEKILGDCRGCASMRQDRRDRVAAEERALVEQDLFDRTRDDRYTERYEHVLEGNDEYEAPEDDVMHDAACTHCGRDPDPRKVRQGLDCLYNCDGCSGSFHPACRDGAGVKQATAQECSKRGIVTVTWARKHNPWLCGKCWAVCRVREAEAETSRLREENARLRHVRARRDAPPPTAAAAAVPNSPVVNSALCSVVESSQKLTEIEERDRLFRSLYEAYLRRGKPAETEPHVSFAQHAPNTGLLSQMRNGKTVSNSGETQPKGGASRRVTGTQSESLLSSARPAPMPACPPLRPQPDRNGAPPPPAASTKPAAAPPVKPCRFCGGPVMIANMTPRSAREAQISGLCQNCQDEMFGLDA